MAFLPVRTVVIESSMTRDELIAALRNNVSMLDARPTHETFEGSVGVDRFELTRRMRYVNHMAPLAIGRIELHHTRDCLLIDFRLMNVARIFMIIYVVIGLMLTVTFLTTKGLPFYWALAPLAVTVIGYLMMLGSFLYDVRKAKRLLSDIVMSTQKH